MKNAQKELNGKVYAELCHDVPLTRETLMARTGLTGKQLDETLRILFEHNMAARTKDWWFGVQLGAVPDRSVEENGKH